MESMKPMAPMQPMAAAEKWWPDDLGHPSISGAQNEIRYAFFPDQQRLLVEHHATLTTYDTGAHQISGISQQQGHTQHLVFTSQDGPIDLTTLPQLS